MKSLKGLQIKGMTSHLASYMGVSLVTFNLCKSPRKTINEISPVQFLKQSSAVGFASPRKETLLKARLVYRNGRDAAWVN